MPRKKHLHITIPQPCTEGRKTMQRAGENLFCGQCQKVITDFSRLSDAEIGRIMMQPDAPTCGRFRRDQLARAIAVVPAVQRSWPRLAAGAVLLLLAMPHALLAQAPAPILAATTTSISQGDDAKANSDLPLPEEDTLFILRGHVLQAYTGEPLSYASITSLHPALEVQSNDSGDFVMMIPTRLLQDTLQLQVAWEGDIHAVAVSIDRQQASAKVTLALEMRAMLLDGVMIVDRPRDLGKVNRKRNSR